MRTIRFLDRREAGRQLAEALKAWAANPDVVVLGLPRGGLPVAYEVALRLGTPLDVFIVRKLGVEGHEELAMGAIASGGVRVLNRSVIDAFHIPNESVERVTQRESAELARREHAYRGDAPLRDLDGRVVVLVDDGLATGSTMLAAVAAARTQNPHRIVVGVPVASEEAREALRHEADDCVCVLCPEPFYGVGIWYEDFRQTSDQEVQQLLQAAARRPALAVAAHS
jgi:putative phosphoribosyl transferase